MTNKENKYKKLTYFNNFTTITPNHHVCTKKRINKLLKWKTSYMITFYGENVTLF